MSEKTASFFKTEAMVRTDLINAGSGRIAALVSMYKNLIRQPSGSCIVVFSLQLLPLIPMLRLSHGNKFRLVADIHDAPRGWMDRLASAGCVRFAHRAISISKYVSKHLWMSSSAVIVPRPIELPASNCCVERADDAPLNIGIVGRVDREKRVDLAVRAVGSLVARMDVRLNVYGAAHLDSDYPAELQQMALQFDKPFVNFAGVKQPVEIYSEIDVLVVANENEPSGRTVGEAMMHGVVVVAPDAGGAGEFFESGVSGLTYRAGSEESLARVLTELAGSPDLRNRLTKNAKNKIELERGTDVAVTAYRNALESTAAK
ncbi:glycosyltransferase family 4 protein [Arthrobacter sp. APC 3897]|uniref:glycosyltransferase family 4 protein n=1 Tax=Arthrobacter sp. APC 3897 TaxID=3035204 RepID=UPI0025B59FFF|nr:glycosyltransferase family 4 protein [Arthrobacter sp. APC 3897]MDN3481511.1 glycosyltransferase family 4 protein [Arthrobacter sp. APC 3897]